MQKQSEEDLFSTPHQQAMSRCFLASQLLSDSVQHTFQEMQLSSPKSENTWQEKHDHS